MMVLKLVYGWRVGGFVDKIFLKVLWAASSVVEGSVVEKFGVATEQA
jgi:hypothetical protein